MYHIIQKKYGYTPERQKELDEVQEGKASEDTSHHSCEKKRY